MLPNDIDLLILDGGPFTGYDEFCLLRARSRYIVLDDTIDIKNFQVYQEIRINPKYYDIVLDDPKDRNGFLICRRKK
jgi:hypothetical protein